MFIFVIDTDKYAGNFERQMTGYMTGLVGECSVGSEEAEEFEAAGFRADHFEQLLTQVADEHGCYRPCAIWPTPGWFNDGLGSEYRDGEEEKARKNFKKSAAKIKLPLVEMTKYPSYQSVAIFMNRPPNKAEVAILLRRAAEWVRNHNVGKLGKQVLHITGFRLLQEKTTQELVNSWKPVKV